MTPTSQGLLLAGYARVSGEEQLKGYGLDVQEADLAQWCERNGHRLLTIYRDEAISGKKDEDDRPGLASALNAIEDGAAGLVVPKLDRLARKVTIQEAALAQVWKFGGRVFSVDQGEILRDDADDPMRTAMRQMVGVFAQLEAGMIAARLRAGRKMKHQRGGYAYGAPRFGMRAKDRELVTDSSEQRTIARMVELAGAGASLRQIASTLTNEGHRPKRGDRWHSESIRRTLARLTPPDPLESTQEVATA